MSSFSSDTKNHSPDGEVAYPTSDGNPMGETDLHREVMVDLIDKPEVREVADDAKARLQRVRDGLQR